MATIDLEVEGMSWRSCVRHVSQALQSLAGASPVAVDLQSGHVRVDGELPGGSVPLVTALPAAGYPAKLFNPEVSTPQPNNSAVGGCCGGS